MTGLLFALMLVGGTAEDKPAAYEAFQDAWAQSASVEASACKDPAFRDHVKQSNSKLAVLTNRYWRTLPAHSEWARPPITQVNIHADCAALSGWLSQLDKTLDVFANKLGGN